jgi:UDP-N-acetylglucosamine diphosphorylase/glucosamine-1-phosphate N-acetyltransferase
MNIVIFEDSQYQNLLPLVYFRPVWELRCGALTLEQKLKHHLQGDYFYLAREYMQKYYLDEKTNSMMIPDDSSALFINGRWLFTETDADTLKGLAAEEALFWEKTVLAFRTSMSNSKNFVEQGLPDNERILNSLKSREYRAKVVEYLWDAIDWNGNQLAADFELWSKKMEVKGIISDGVHFVEKNNVHVAETAQLKPGVVVDASEGPVWIAEKATVMPNAVLEGPIYVGRNSLIKIGAKIYGSTSIGPVCKVGGEVEGSIIQGYSNKQHDGFLGHAYLGSWINIGADTNNSDLKNTYGNIDVLLNGEPKETGKQFLGLMMGDHSKTAINVMFNTGTIVGACCNVFGAGMPPKFIPSFSWGGAEKMVEYRLDKIMEVAKLVMHRRKIEFTNKDERLFNEVRELAGKVEKVSSR